MFQTKAGVLDRIAQSFSLFLKAPFSLFLPITIFNLLMMQIVPAILFAIIPVNNIGLENIGVYISILMSIAIIYALIYIIILIPITVSIIKTSFDIVKEKQIHIGDNISYGFSRLGRIFKVYWYIFEYVYFYPALGFIIGGMSVLIGLISDVEVYRNIGFIIIVLSVIWALIWGIHRGIKITFSITHALFTENYEKIDFKNALKITDGNWWRILGNLILVGLIGGFITSLVSGLLSSISFLGSDFESILQIENNSPSLENILGNIGNFNAVTFITDSIGNILGSVLSAFIILFIVVFYLRLKAEYKNSQQTDSKDITTIPTPKNIEL